MTRSTATRIILLYACIVTWHAYLVDAVCTEDDICFTGVPDICVAHGRNTSNGVRIDELGSTAFSLADELSFQGRMNTAWNILDNFGHIDKASNGLTVGAHISLHYSCCYTSAEETAFKAALSTVRFDFITVGFEGVDCERIYIDASNSSNDLYSLKVDADQAGQLALGNITASIEAALIAQGLPVFNPRNTPYHVTLASVRDNYPRDAAITAANTQITNWPSVRLRCFYFDTVDQFYCGGQVGRFNVGVSSLFALIALIFSSSVAIYQ